jgi:hypothetical protein
MNKLVDTNCPIQFNASKLNLGSGTSKSLKMIICPKLKKAS